jgi:hypothetical protein
MPLKVIPPFHFVPRIADVLHVDPDEVSLRRLRDIVAGKDTSFPVPRAMALLHATDFPNKHRDFAAVLEDEKQPSELRYLAAIYLGKITAPAAMHILIHNSNVRDELVLSGVMRALGCIGDRSALAAISQAKQHAHGLAMVQAEFAQTLIAHREGVHELDVAVAEQTNHLTMDANDTHPFEIIPANSSAAELCLRSLADQPYGIEYSEQSMYQARCGRSNWMILFNRDFAQKNTTVKLRKQLTLLGTIALRDAETGLYSTMYLVLTAPAIDQQTVNILVYRTAGRLIFAGSAVIKDNHAEFSILAVRRAGAYSLQVDGVFEDGRLDIHTALSTSFIPIQKNEPGELSSDTYEMKPAASI